MQEHMARRVKELKDELARGQARMAALDNERQQLSQAMLRIAGAIEVLEELAGQPAEG